MRSTRIGKGYRPDHTARARTIPANCAGVRPGLFRSGNHIRDRCQLLNTSLVGSYARPDWLIDGEKLTGQFPPRLSAKELWRVPPRHLAEAQDSATLAAIKLQEQAGLDIITDGEIRRESCSNRFAAELDGPDLDDPGTVLSRARRPNPVPRIVGRISRRHPVEPRGMKFPHAHTERMTKMTLSGAFAVSQQALNGIYPSLADAAMDYAKAVKAEIADLFAAVADIVQIDEPYMQARPDEAEK